MRWLPLLVLIVAVPLACEDFEPTHPTGDCTTDAECGGDDRCVSLTEGGYRVCTQEQQWLPATECNGAADACCTDADCPAGFSSCVYEREGFFTCGGTEEGPGNKCRDLEDRCETDEDCLDEDGPNICAPAGTWGVNYRHCRRATCRKHSDCTAFARGVCAPVETECSCGLREALTCVYPEGGCRLHSDCPVGSVCHIREDIGQAVCRAPDPSSCI